MITSVSALLDRKTRRAVLADLNRGRAVARFREEGLPVPDIALALNCSRPIIDYFLLRQKPWFRKNEEKLRTKRQARDLRFIKRHDRGLILYRPPRTEEGIARERELLAGHLALEVRRWVCELEQSDANCQSVIERAGLLLDQSPLNMRGEYVFDADRAAEEVLRIWKPEACDAGDLEFRKRGARQSDEQRNGSGQHQNCRGRANGANVVKNLMQNRPGPPCCSESAWPQAHVSA